MQKKNYYVYNQGFIIAIIIIKRLILPITVFNNLLSSMNIMLLIELNPVETAAITRTRWCKYEVDVMKAFRGCSDFSCEIQEIVLSSRVSQVHC